MARARSEALLALLLICAAFSAAAAAAGTGRAKGGSDHTEAPPCQDLATQGEWRREQVPVVPQRGARRHVLRGRLPRQVFSCELSAGVAHARK
jgi:hypothetical protein